MMSLTHAQAELLDYIEKFQASNSGISPSFEEMKEAMGLHSKSGVHRLLLALEQRGRIIRYPHLARAIEIVNETDLSGVPSAVLIAELARRGAARRAA